MVTGFVGESRRIGWRGRRLCKMPVGALVVMVRGRAGLSVLVFGRGQDVDIRVDVRERRDYAGRCERHR